MSVIASTAHTDIKRHLRSPALWLIGLAAPIAALFMVPPPDANYAVLTVNEAVPVMNPAVLGLELGVVTATILTPLAYIFLRAGATKRRPWQVTDVAPHSRPAMTLGRWAADTMTLWIVLAALTIAGIILGLFRAQGTGWNPLQTTLALWLPAAPAMALIAAVRVFFDSRPLLRRWPGDVLFFVLWLAAMILSIAGSGMMTDGGGVKIHPLSDPLGFVTPITASFDGPISGVTIGGAPNYSDRIEIDAMAGVTHSGFLLSRLVWVTMALGLAAISGWVYKPRLAKMPKQGVLPAMQHSSLFAMTNVTPLKPSAAPKTLAPWLATILSEVRLLLRGKVWLALLAGAAIAGAVLPYMPIGGPVIWLALLFPLTAEAGRWQNRTTRQFLETTGVDRWQRAGLLLAASVAIFSVAHIPAIGRMIALGTCDTAPQMAGVIIGVPLAAVALGTLTRGPVAGRLILLMAWYAMVSAG